MNTKKINEQAIESLKTYFNEGKDLIKENVTPLTKDQIKASRRKRTSNGCC